jgi:hypothetical protein
MPTIQSDSGTRFEIRHQTVNPIFAKVKPFLGQITEQAIMHDIAAAWACLKAYNLLDKDPKNSGLATMLNAAFEAWYAQRQQ